MKLAKLSLLAIFAASAVNVSAQTINTSAFSLEAQGANWWMSTPALQSDAAGSASIWLGTGPCCGDVPAGRDGTANGDYANLTYRLTVKQGYRVTGFSLAATLTGKLEPGELNGVPGVANNNGGFSFTAYRSTPLDSLLQREYKVSQLNGSELKTLSDEAVLPSSFLLDLYAGQNAYAQGVPFEECHPYWGCNIAYSHASASMWVKDMVLTVHTAPVPEPETYAMLLGGLAVTGFLARRRQRKAEEKA